MKAAKSYKLNDIVEVEWEDCATAQGWRTRGATHCIAECRTIGYFLAVDGKKISLSHAFDVDDGSRMDTQSIPLSTVTRMRRLERARK